jgi:hypothetical protein
MPSSKALLRCAILAVAVMFVIAAGPRATASTILIQNPGFESAVLSDVGNGTFSQLIPGSTIFATAGTLDSWSAASTTTGAAAGGFDPSPGGVNWATTWWTGNNIAYMQINAPGTVSLSQVLSTNLVNNTAYTLSMEIGRRSFTPTYACTVQLLAGTTVLNSVACPALASNSSGTTGTLTLTYNSGASNPLAGQALRIALSITDTGTGLEEAFFDQLALDGTTAGSVPEPGTVTLLATGLLGLSIIRRKQTSR